MQMSGFQCPPRCGGGEATTLKKVFKILTLFGVFSACFFGLLLLYNGTILSDPKTWSQHWESAGNGTLETQAGVQQVQPNLMTAAPSVPREEEEEEEREKEEEEKEKETGEPSVDSTPPCPDNPPDLLGPLVVDLKQSLTLDEVRREVSSPLREGGRYKPPDCVSKHKVAVVIPFRNRHQHLNYWLYYLHPIFLRQQLDYGVYVINQEGEGRFNRAKLMNVGYVEALKDYDYDCFVFSDVDLIPMDDRNLYRCFDNPRHLAVAMDKFNFHLPYATFFGGVSSLSKDQYLKINGFPNTYWGWGGEDDDAYRRIRFRDMQISRPDLLTGRYKMIKHRRDLHNEPNPENPRKLGKTKWTMDQDGINTLKYTVKEIVKDILYTNITVNIEAPPG